MNETIIEEVGGEFGATVRYLLNEYGVAVDFFAAEITGREGDSNKPLYWRKGADSSSDHTDDFSQAERYVEGSVKWDGCSHVSFGDEYATLHVCGRADCDKLALILATIYERCGELIKASGTELLDGEFTGNPATQATACASPPSQTIQ